MQADLHDRTSALPSRWQRLRAGAGLALLFATFGAPAAFANSYTVVDLGLRRIPGEINNRGNVTGNDWDFHAGALVYRGSHWRRLEPAGYYASAINAYGDVAGQDVSWGLSPGQGRNGLPAG